MKKLLSKNKPLFVLFALVLAVLSSGRVAYGSERVCYDDWAIAGTHIELRSLVPVKDIRKLAGEKLEGDLIKIKLCSDADRFVYQLVMFAPDGKVQKLAVDAKEPEFN